MIRYQLVCPKDHSFEGWFRDSAAYDTQAKNGLLACPTCNAKKIAKAPKAPAISKNGEHAEDAANPAHLSNSGNGTVCPCPDEKPVGGIDTGLVELRLVAH